MLSTNDIDKKATTLLQDVFGSIGSLKLPVDLNEVALYCNLTVKQGDFKDADIEGALDRSSNTVYLSEHDTHDRKNFTLAHEIGHLKLHQDVNTELFFMHQLADLLIPGGDEKEAAADEFAAALLIPAQSLKALWKVNKSVIDLAGIFDVPTTVMRYRIKTLKLKSD